VIFKSFSFLPILFLLSKLLFASQSPDLFWMSQIENGLRQRTVDFASIGIGGNISNVNSLDENTKELVLSRINLASSTQNTWYNFVKGVLFLENNSLTADSLFAHAIQSASSDPGVTWLLFVEFNRYKIDSLAEKCLYQLHKQLLNEGAISSLLISSQILNYAYAFEKQHDYTMSKKFFGWVERFDPNQTLTIKKRFQHSIPTDIDSMKSAAISYWTTLSRSWTSQLNHFIAFYSWLRTFLAILMFSIFALVMIKYFPAAIHFIADVYPFSISITFRTLLASMIILATMLFSVYFFLWVVAILVWQHVNKKDKLLFAFAIFLLILTPVDTRIVDMTQKATDPDGAIMAYKMAVVEGYSEARDKKTIINLPNEKQNSLSLLSSSINAYKKGDLQSAQLFIEKTLDLTPDDPVALVMAGNISFQKDLFDKAKDYFEKAMSLHYRDASATFNLSQCYMNQMEVIKGTELMNQAAKENPLIVNTFIRQNDLLYSKNWPPLRRLIIPDYTPTFFWNHIYFKNSGNWDTTNRRWGTAFLGINASTSIVVFCAIFLFLFFSTFFKSPVRIKKMFECKYCGRIVCKKCSHGILCTACDSLTEFIKNDKKLEKLRLRVLQKFSFWRFQKEMVLDIVIPGAASFLNSKKSSKSTLWFLTISSAVYASYIAIFHISGKYNLGIEFFFPLVLLLLYSLSFLLRRINDLIKYSKSSSRNQV
jgi:tetratricopeptide (TPR) repeat protein